MRKEDEDEMTELTLSDISIHMSSEYITRRALFDLL